MAVTMMDLYPKPTWSFAFGEADLEGGVGVFSFARYVPRQATGAASLLLRRALQVMVHEALHLFGLGHCLYYECCMQGSNSLEESDR